MMRNHNSILKIDSYPDTSGKNFDPRPYFEPFRQSDGIVLASVNHCYFPEHWGPLSIKGVLSGYEYFNVNHRKYKLDADHFLVLNPNMEYSSFIDSPDQMVATFTLLFSQSTFCQYIASQRGVEKNLDDPDAKKSFEFSERLFRYPDQLKHRLNQLFESAFTEGASLRTEELFLQVLGDLIKNQNLVCNEIEKIAAVKASTRAELYKRLFFARDYIYSNFEEDITLAQLSKIAMLAPEYMLRQFKELFQITPHQMLANRRIEAARELLISGKLSVSEVCHRVGYKDLTSFGKKFKQAFGCVPSKL